MPREAKDKVKRYSWSSPGDTGRYRKIKVSDLHVDHDYQRPEVSKSNTLNIARDFNWARFGALVVMERKGGGFYVIDGQQRLSAVLKRGDIKEVPCIVHSSSSKMSEAENFLAVNTNRKGVSSLHKFRAAVMAKQEPQVSIQKFLDEMGLVPAGGGNIPGKVSFVSTLVAAWASDKEAARNALEAHIYLLMEGEAPHGEVFKGLWWLFHNGVDVWEYVDKLNNLGGQAACIHAIAQFAIELGANRNRSVCGRAILRLINKKRRNRIVVENGVE